LAWFFPVWIGLVFLQKPVQTGLDQFFGLTRFFRFGSVLAHFGSVFSGWGLVRFFQFRAYKTEPVSFFNILIGFFYGSVFPVFKFNQFLIFLFIPTIDVSHGR